MQTRDTQHAKAQTHAHTCMADINTHTHPNTHIHIRHTFSHKQTHTFTQPLSFTCVCTNSHPRLVRPPGPLWPGPRPSQVSSLDAHPHLAPRTQTHQTCSHLGLCTGLPSARRPSRGPCGHSLTPLSVKQHFIGAACLDTLRPLRVSSPSVTLPCFASHGVCRPRCGYLHNGYQCSIHMETSFVFSVTPLISKITCET